MAMSSVIRKSYSTAIPLALRAVASPRILNDGSLLNALSTQNPVHATVDNSFLSHKFSTVALAKKTVDHKFLKVLRSELKSAKRLDLENKIPQTPPNFPFTIEAKDCSHSIKLHREFEGEKIEILVCMPSDIYEEDALVDDEVTSDTSDDDSNNGKGNQNKNKNGSDDVSSSDDDSSDDNDDYEPDYSPAQKIPMTVAITKENGDSIEISVLASADDIVVQDMLIKEPSENNEVPTLFKGPDVQKWDFDVKYSLRKYLEIRGIKEKNVEFLYKFMVRKSMRDDVIWLRKLKNFVKK